MDFDKIKNKIITWAAVAGIVISCLKFLFMPWMQAVMRAESNKVLYVIYSQFAQEYESIPERLPHQEARLSELKERQALYRHYVRADYEAGLTSALPE